MTEAGQAAFARAEEVFQIRQVIPDEVREAASGKVARLAVGLSDGISKLAAHALLEPVLATPSLRLVCHEGEFEQLLAELALHHLDLVLAGECLRHNGAMSKLARGLGFELTPNADGETLLCTLDLQAAA